MLDCVVLVVFFMIGFVKYGLAPPLIFPVICTMVFSVYWCAMYGWLNHTARIRLPWERIVASAIIMRFFPNVLRFAIFSMVPVSVASVPGVSPFIEDSSASSYLAGKW